jgi:hypothetical protein
MSGTHCFMNSTLQVCASFLISLFMSLLGVRCRTVDALVDCSSTSSIRRLPRDRLIRVLPRPHPFHPGPLRPCRGLCAQCQHPDRAAHAHDPRAGARRVALLPPWGRAHGTLCCSSGVYPALTPAGVYVRKGMQLRFQVGVCASYKPARAHAVEAGRTFGLVGKDASSLRSVAHGALAGRARRRCMRLSRASSARITMCGICIGM